MRSASSSNEGTRVGPLHGVKVVELAGIGPGPFAGTLLSDMGADVVRVERVELVGASDASEWLRVRRAWSPCHRGRPEASRRRRDGAAVGRAGRRADRGLPAGRHRAARPGPRGLPRPQPAAGVRAHDRLGAGGSARARGRPRHQLHLARRRARALRSRRCAADATVEHDRRLRRGRDVPRLRGGVRAARSAHVRAGAGHRRGDGRRRRLPHGRRCGACAAWVSSREERGTNLLDTGSPYYDVYETADGHWVSIGVDRAAVLRAAARAHRRAPRRPARADGPHRLAGAARAAHRGVRGEDPGGVDRAARGDRRVLRAGAADERGEAATRISWRVVRSSSTTAWSSRRPHRASRAPRPRSRVRRRCPARTPTRCSRRTASPSDEIAKLAASGAVKQRSG